MNDNNTSMSPKTLDKEHCDLIAATLQQALDGQANTFDQIDAKTGVALGFTFVAVGQVLAAVLRMAADASSFHVLHPIRTRCIFYAALSSALVAVVFGAIARWPLDFEHSYE